MIVYGLIGYPLEHSFSQAYFTQKFRESGLADHVYRNFPLVSIADFPKLIATEPELHGLNVTIPHKESVIPYLNDLSTDAEEIGAINTICFESHGLVGYNTDWIGFKRSLEPLLSLWPGPPEALILGTGGSSKAVAYALSRLGIRYTIVSRERRVSGLTYAELSDSLISATNLIINTTPLGMSPKTGDAPPLPYNALTAKHLLYDLIYNPAQSQFLTEGQARGARIKNGLEMLQIQADEALALWQRNSSGLSY